MSYSSFPETASSGFPSGPSSFMSKPTLKDQAWKEVWNGRSQQLSFPVMKISAGYKYGEARWEMTIQIPFRFPSKVYAEPDNLMVFHKAIETSDAKRPTELPADDQSAARKFIDKFEKLNPWAEDFDDRQLDGIFDE